MRVRTKGVTSKKVAAHRQAQAGKRCHTLVKKRSFAVKRGVPGKPTKINSITPETRESAGNAALRPVIDTQSRVLNRRLRDSTKRKPRAVVRLCTTSRYNPKEVNTGPPKSKQRDSQLVSAMVKSATMRFKSRWLNKRKLATKMPKALHASNSPAHFESGTQVRTSNRPHAPSLIMNPLSRIENSTDASTWARKSQEKLGQRGTFTPKATKKKRVRDSQADESAS